MYIPYLTLASFALSRLGLSDTMKLYEAAGSAEELLKYSDDVRAVVPDASLRLVEMIREELPMHRQRAEEECRWCEKNKVRIVTINDSGYPHRLRSCHDAPMALFVRGKADLNSKQVINIVGTRKCSAYGQDAVAAIVRDLASSCPGLLIVSGLAYGIDIAAHRAALANGLPTVGVVAHGQDTLYPATHRNEANKMALGEGAVITEFFHGTRPEARNFLQRNRIIAGISDATLVAESASHGGGLVTARIAQDYGREVFAVPGSIFSEASRGCNNLIRDSKACAVTSARDVINIMQWENAAVLDKARKEGISQSLFVELTTDEQMIVDVLRKGDMQANNIALVTSLPMGKLNAMLFSLEMRGIIKMMPGNSYHLVLS